MSRDRVKPLPQGKKTKRMVFHKPTSKELDLMLLAGCSCLMTLLYHPVADTLRAHSTSAAMQAAPTQPQRGVTTSGHFYVSLPPVREELKEEE
jgi:hypothetical protein